MITFLDGPAKGQRLDLRRAPLFLRVTESAVQWDALDQLDDEPRPNETIHVYQLAEEPAICHWDGRDKAGRRISGTRMIATYRHVPNTPDDKITRDTANWRAWCQRLAGKEA